jgi:hypothetical protein
MKALDPKNLRLLDIIKEVYLDRKISGEDKNKLLLFLICVSALTKNALSAIVKGLSGAGKSHLVNRVLDIFRKMGMVIEFSRITGAYLENMASKDHPPKPQRRGDIDDTYEERLLEWKNALRRVDLTGKILFIDELKGIQNAQAPKLLISEGRLKLGTVINGEPVEIEVKGSPVIITTTTLAVLDDPEFENRVIPVQIDESEEQTKRVLEHEAEHYEDPAEDLTEYKKDQALIELFSQLKPYQVANPFARKLADDYPKKNIEARRDYRKLISLCNVVTWLYQHQRVHATKGLDIVVVADLKDVEKVKELALGPLRESLAGVSPYEDKILDFLKEEKRVERDSFGNEQGRYYEWKTVKDVYRAIREQTRRGEQWTRDHVNRLVQEGYIEEHPDNIPGRKGLRYRYAELQPEILELNTEQYSRQVLTDWAQKHGYRITAIPALDWDMNQDHAKPSPLEKLDPGDPPNSGFGKQSLPAGEPGLGQLGNELLSQPDPNGGIVCSQCHIKYPDQPSFDNHLDTYKHDR